jgi:hypothetical protein
MNPLVYIITFIQIIIKGCTESLAIKAALILLFSIAALTFIPYWVGLLLIAGGAMHPPAWLAGIVFITIIGFIIMVLTLIYMVIYTCIKPSTRRR